MRFWSHEILDELDSVLEQIALVLIKIPSPQPFYTRRVPPEGEGVSLIVMIRLVFTAPSWNITVECRLLARAC